MSILTSLPLISIPLTITSNESSNSTNNLLHQNAHSLILANRTEEFYHQNRRSQAHHHQQNDFYHQPNLQNLHNRTISLQLSPMIRDDRSSPQSHCDSDTRKTGGLSDEMSDARSSSVSSSYQTDNFTTRHDSSIDHDNGVNTVDDADDSDDGDEDDEDDDCDHGGGDNCDQDSKKIVIGNNLENSDANNNNNNNNNSNDHMSCCSEDSELSVGKEIDSEDIIFNGSDHVKGDLNIVNHLNRKLKKSNPNNCNFSISNNSISSSGKNVSAIRNNTAAVDIVDPDSRDSLTSISAATTDRTDVYDGELSNDEIRRLRDRNESLSTTTLTKKFSIVRPSPTRFQEEFLRNSQLYAEELMKHQMSFMAVSRGLNVTNGKQLTNHTFGYPVRPLSSTSSTSSVNHLLSITNNNLLVRSPPIAPAPPQPPPPPPQSSSSTSLLPSTLPVPPLQSLPLQQSQTSLEQINHIGFRPHVRQQIMVDPLPIVKDSQQHWIDDSNSSSHSHSSDNLNFRGIHSHLNAISKITSNLTMTNGQNDILSSNGVHISRENSLSPSTNQQHQQQFLQMMNNNNLNERNLKFSIDNILKPGFGRRITDPLLKRGKNSKRTNGGQRTQLPNNQSSLKQRKNHQINNITATSTNNSVISASSMPIDLTAGLTTTASPPITEPTLSPLSVSSIGTDEHEKSMLLESPSKNLISTVTSTSSSSTSVSTTTSSSSSGPMVWPAWVYCTRYSDRPSSGRSPRTRRPKKPPSEKGSSSDEKRPRTAFSGPQLQRLKHEFAESRYLTERRRQQLSSELGLNEAQIKIWFQNKRAKIKKSSGQKNPLALQLMAQGLYNHSTVPLTREEEELQELQEQAKANNINQ